MNNNKKKIFIITGISLLVLIVIIGGTYAWYVWTTSDNEVTKIVAGVGSATVTFDGGSDISANLKPVADKSNGIVKTIKVKSDTAGLLFNMYLDIVSIDTGLKDVSFKYEFYKGETKVKEGNFTDTYLNSNTATCSTNSTKHITLLSNESISTSSTIYTLYIWIDGANYTNPNTMMNKKFDFKLHANGEGAVVKQILGNAAQYITNLYTNADKEEATNYTNRTVYSLDTGHLLMDDRLGGAVALNDSKGNIRYYGNAQTNYVYFNCSDYVNQSSNTCELWRIIGVFDGKLKIIRNDYIAYDDIPLDYDKTVATYWKNTITAALLNPWEPGCRTYWNATENPNYICNSRANSLYQEFSSQMIGISFQNDETRNMITSYPKYLYSLASVNNAIDQGIENVYQLNVNMVDNTENDIYVGILDLIDYGYAALFADGCYDLSSLSSYAECGKETWMYISSGKSEFLINSENSKALQIKNTDTITEVNFTSEGGVLRPVVYLNSNVRFSYGAGTEDEPYQLLS